MSDASLLLNMFVTWLWFVMDERHTNTIFVWGKRVLPILTLALLLTGIFA